MKLYVKKIKQFILDEDGTTTIEYAVIVALFSIVLIGSAEAVAAGVAYRFDAVSNTVNH